MPGLYGRDVVVDGSGKFAPRPIPRDHSGRSDDEAFGVVEARAWLANRGGVIMPLPAYSARRARRP